MSAIQNQIIEFLDSGGRDLDYDEDTLPNLDDMHAVLKNNIAVWEYFGKTHEEYYGGSDE